MLVVLRVGYAWVQWMERFDEVRKGKDKMGPYLKEAMGFMGRCWEVETACSIPMNY